MPNKFLTHAFHGLARTKSFLNGAYHTTRKALQHIDTYSGMFRRVLAAAQPALQDLGIQDQTNRVAMQAVSAYDNAKAILRKHEDKLHVLAQELIKQETLTGDQVRHLIGLKEPQRKASPPAGGKGGDKEAGDGCSETKTEGPSAGSNNKAGTGNKPARSWWFGS